jgi:hydroxyacylglutathione hydrolase
MGHGCFVSRDAAVSHPRIQRRSLHPSSVGLHELREAVSLCALRRAQRDARRYGSGDSQFTGRANTTFVAASPEALTAFFGLKGWPDTPASYTLGGRAIDIIPIPGHEPASIALYDRRTGLLLTGDTLYPGRLYVRDGPAFAASVQRLVAFTRDKPIAHILGAHIENTRTPYLDYPEGTTYQPDEHALELGRAHLLELNEAVMEMRGPIVRRILRTSHSSRPVHRQ